MARLAAHIDRVTIYKIGHVRFGPGESGGRSGDDKIGVQLAFEALCWTVGMRVEPVNAETRRQMLAAKYQNTTFSTRHVSPEKYDPPTFRGSSTHHSSSRVNRYILTEFASRHPFRTN